MSRMLSEAEAGRDPNPDPHRRKTQVSKLESGSGSAWHFWPARGALIGGLTVSAALLRPYGLHWLAAALSGLLAAGAILLAEALLERASPGAAIGSFLGLLAGLLMAYLIGGFALRILEPGSTKSFLAVALWIAGGYLGLIAGGLKGGEILDGTTFRLTGLVSEPNRQGSVEKLLDTSVLIDGRIADICESHFLDGPLLVPQFVLKELQFVADSSDTLRRQRGRRGLEVLHRMQKMAHEQIQVLEDEDGPQNVDVDQKLIELARRRGAKILTNDFNLNKVASVQGIGVLNVNELANALRPAVLPGEAMRVFILREGKEANQGVAYLEDGTMVVVDGGRRLINKTVDIVVTSVHQTPAGKMIFGRLDERNEPGTVTTKHAAAGGSRASRSGLPSEE